MRDVSKTQDLWDFMAENRGRVLSDQLLMLRFFPGPRGYDHLTTAIAIIRQSQPVERVPCVGYRMPLEER